MRMVKIHSAVVREVVCGGKETVGKTHLVRAEQVIEFWKYTVVTGCSFCYGMMNQGLGPLTPQDQEPIKVKDVADIVAENLS